MNKAFQRSMTKPSTLINNIVPHTTENLRVVQLMRLQSYNLCCSSYTTRKFFVAAKIRKGREKQRE